MTTEPTPRQRIAAGIAEADQGHARALLARTASSYRPEYDEEADRLVELGKTTQLPAGVRTALGFHQEARKAHAELAALGDTS